MANRSASWVENVRRRTYPLDPNTTATPEARSRVEAEANVAYPRTSARQNANGRGPEPPPVGKFKLCSSLLAQARGQSASRTSCIEPTVDEAAVVSDPALSDCTDLRNAAIGSTLFNVGK